MPWRPIGLRVVKAPTLLRQTANRWRQGCQPYAPAALHPQVSFFIFLCMKTKPEIAIEWHQCVSKFCCALQLWEVNSARGIWTLWGSGTMASTVPENRQKNNSVAVLPLSSTAAPRGSRWSRRMPPGKARSAAATMDTHLDWREVW
jgi:hypothetical protein